MTEMNAEDMRAIILDTLLGLTPAEQEVLADVMTSVSESAQRSRSLGKARQAQYPHRILQDGAAVILDGDGTRAALNTTSLADTLNFKNHTVRINKANRRQMDITAMGGGADCEFNYLVSGCYLTQTLFTFTEGMEFTTASGCTYKGYSTLTLALANLDTLANGTDAMILICPGTYTDQPIYHSQGGTVVIRGSGIGQTTFKPTTSGNILSTQIDATVGIPDFVLSDMTVDSSSMTGANTLLNGSGGGINRLFRVQLIVASGDTGINMDNGSGNSGGWSLDLCELSGAGTGILCNAANGNLTYTNTRNDCAIGISLINGGSQLYIGGTSKFTGATGISIAQQFWNKIYIDAIFEGCTTGVALATDAGFTNEGHVSIRGLFTNCTTGISIGNAASAFIESISVNATFAGQTSSGAHATRVGIALGSNANLRYSQIFGCVFSGYTSGNEITGTAGTGTIQVHNVSDAGTMADVGSPYGHAAAATAAPTPHDLVSVHHDHEEDHTSTLKLLGIEVSTGDINLYSDAGVTRVASLDGATGHITLGGAGAPSADSIMQSLEIFTDPAAAKYSFNMAIAMLMTANNALAMNGVFSRLRVRGSFTASGIWAAVTSDIFRIADSPVVNDYRGFYAIATGGTGLTIVDRYGLRVDDGIGAGSITNQYGVYIENMAKGGTLNRAIYSAGGASVHGGNFTIGGLLVPSTTLDVRGAVTLDGVAASGTPASDDIVVYNETATDLLKAKEDNGAVYALTHKHVVIAILDNATASTTIPYVVTAPMPHAGTIVTVKSLAGEDKVCGATAWIGDIHKIPAAYLNTDGTGTSIFTTKPTITNGNQYQAYGAPDSVTTFAAGDAFAWYTDQTGTTLTVVTMSMEVRYT